jgi:RNA polymerase sigma-70 factor (ECF subfamily)
MKRLWSFLKSMTSLKSKRIEDEVLIAQYCAGNTDAVAELYRRHYGRSVSVASRIVKRKHLAEEIVQEAFILVLRKAHQFNGESKFSTWLHQIVVRCGLMSARSPTMTPKTFIPESAVGRRELADALRSEGLRTYQNSDPLLARRMQKAFTRLKPLHKKAVVLFFVAEAEESLVASTLKSTIPAVKSFKMRGKRDFKRAIIAVARELDIAA